MNAKFSLFEISIQEDGHAELALFQIACENRLGALISVMHCPNCGLAFDLFWVGLMMKQPPE